VPCRRFPEGAAGATPMTVPITAERSRALGGEPEDLGT
jgi:hypothetical protein